MREGRGGCCLLGFVCLLCLLFVVVLFCGERYKQLSVGEEAREIGSNCDIC